MEVTMFALRDVGNGQFIDADFGVDEDDESFEEELSTDHVSIYELAPSYDHEAFESHDEDLEQTVWSSFLLGSDYDWDDGLEVDIREWLYERYGDVIAWNDEFGFRPSPHPSFTAETVLMSVLFLRQKSFIERIVPIIVLNVVTGLSALPNGSGAGPAVHADCTVIGTDTKFSRLRRGAARSSATASPGFSFS